MKLAFFLGMFLSMSAFAYQDEIKLQFPQENGQYFLASTASEIGQHIAKETLNIRAEALCQHLGYKRLVKANSTILGVDKLKVNELKQGKVVTTELKKEHKYLYSYHHAVINDLHCSNIGEGGEVSMKSLSNVGREIAIEKGTKNHSRIRSLESSQQ